MSLTALDAAIVIVGHRAYHNLLGGRAVRLRGIDGERLEVTLLLMAAAHCRHCGSLPLMAGSRPPRVPFSLICSASWQASHLGD